MFYGAQDGSQPCGAIHRNAIIAMYLLKQYSKLIYAWKNTFRKDNIEPTIYNHIGFDFESIQFKKCTGWFPAVRHPLRDIGWGDTSFDINAFKAHSKQKDIKQDDCIHYGTLSKRTLNRAILFFYLNTFTAHSKQLAGFFRAVRLFNIGISDFFFFRI